MLHPSLPYLFPLVGVHGEVDQWRHHSLWRPSLLSLVQSHSGHKDNWILNCLIVPSKLVWNVKARLVLFFKIPWSYYLGVRSRQGRESTQLKLSMDGLPTSPRLPGRETHWPLFWREHVSSLSLFLSLFFIILFIKS